MTTLMFDIPENGFDRLQWFIVQVIGLDKDEYCDYLKRKPGIKFYTLEKAQEYASQANSNGWDCKIHLS